MRFLSRLSLMKWLVCAFQISELTMRLLGFSFWCELWFLLSRVPRTLSRHTGSRPGGQRPCGEVCLGLPLAWRMQHTRPCLDHTPLVLGVGSRGRPVPSSRHGDPILSVESISGQSMWRRV